jgi:ARG and Rhodanese-Phosphatase-superfamily-associated Protein domain
MERSLLSALAGALLGISALGSAAFVGAGSGSPGPQPKPEGDWRLLDPITYENISIFPVISSISRDTSAFVTLDEGLSSGEVIVREQGSDGMARSRGVALPQYNTSASVNQLVLINRGKRPVVLLAGELVSGGKQDRIIAKDRIVAPGSDPLPLDVFCVEHGRWSSGLQFSAANTMVHPSVREQAAVNQSQTEVWDSVRKGTTATSADISAAAAAPAPRIAARELNDALASAPTQSYSKIYQHSRVGVSVDDFVDEIQRRFARATSGGKGEHIVGVVVAYGGEVAWSDIFASSDLFHHYWPKLLRSYAVEALARPTLREVASRDDADEFLRRLRGREQVESEPGVYRWSEVNEGRLAQIELEALEPKPMTLHRLLLHRTS